MVTFPGGTSVLIGNGRQLRVHKNDTAQHAAVINAASAVALWEKSYRCLTEPASDHHNQINKA